MERSSSKVWQRARRNRVRKQLPARFRSFPFSVSSSVMKNPSVENCSAQEPTHTCNLKGVSLRRRRTRTTGGRSCSQRAVITRLLLLIVHLGLFPKLKLVCGPKALFQGFEKATTAGFKLCTRSRNLCSSADLGPLVVAHLVTSFQMSESRRSRHIWEMKATFPEQKSGEKAPAWLRCFNQRR